MKAKRSVEGLRIEELLTIRDTEANWPDGRTDLILDLFGAERGLTGPGV